MPATLPFQNFFRNSPTSASTSSPGRRPRDEPDAFRCAGHTLTGRGERLDPDAPDHRLVTNKRNLSDPWSKDCGGSRYGPDRSPRGSAPSPHGRGLG